MSDIREKDISDLGSAFSKFNNLQIFQLNLSWNKLGSQGLLGLCLAIEHLTYLIDLSINLSSKIVGYENIQKLGTALAGFKYLSKLDLNLSSNNIGDFGACSLANSLQNLSNLNSLKLNLRSVIAALQNIIQNQKPFIGNKLSAFQCLKLSVRNPRSDQGL
ncbi:hypothetical protein ABPG72_005387 [Tetrahymena utriculariae]